MNCPGYEVRQGPISGLMTQDDSLVASRYPNCEHYDTEEDGARKGDVSTGRPLS